MLSGWFRSCEIQTYWLADCQAHQRAVKEFGFGFEESLPLFSGALFEQVTSLSPWLVPVSNELLDLKEETLGQGIGLASTASINSLVDHLRSLLFASFNGEEVMFRYYDNNVIEPMLRAMEEDERNRFLGNIDQLAVSADALQCYVNGSVTSYSLQTQPWWKIQEHHLAALYNAEVHARSIERRWWNLFPQMMARLNNPQMLIVETLEKAQTQGYEPEIHEACVMVEIARRTQTQLSDLTQPFQLTFDELNTLETINKVWIS
ncbi:DUF4123 domain-containing protein [Vibrio aquaticus]|uniref:DUF4123 domain-containing protein n=1 Tax=Vibrio aquaticus TaxID=2496559 RepID=A0A3S0Q2J7_9VIBR|nr:DUF4123 domain-containing protein [Vibrio aquaticus]RTZ16723.1 DUF4123 domain-containing protein [Vibrio aquaticus]